ncbi:MAG: CocE/NonD family hydrolase, partial [Kiritimatiellaeota bacterium]|nr:CocE/NonD family hydrolase [Kiritimatiellota bacterium]
GRYASDGEFRVFTEQTCDGEDGYDTIEWLAAQSWCDGCVGTMGPSYLGWMQWMAARTRPPHLVAMCARSIPVELTDVDWPGAFRPGRRIHWWFNTLAPDLRRRAGLPPPHTPQEARAIWDEIEQGSRLGLLPWGRVPKYLPPPLGEQAADWLRHPNRRAWRFVDAHTEITVPNLDFTGWYDHCQSLAHFTGMRRNARTPLAREQTRVVCGPWSHVTIGRRETLGVDFGPGAALDTVGLEIRWFDRWLKGIENGVDLEPAMRYFVIGSSQWKSTDAWPP